MEEPPTGFAAKWKTVNDELNTIRGMFAARDVQNRIQMGPILHH